MRMVFTVEVVGLGVNRFMAVAVQIESHYVVVNVEVCYIMTPRAGMDGMALVIILTSLLITIGLMSSQVYGPFLAEAPP